MSLIASVFCLKCENFFDEHKRKVCAGLCGHSICESCFDSRTSATCPVCHTVNAFNKKIVNYDAMKMVKPLMAAISIKTVLDFNFDPKDLNQGKCSECGNFSAELRLCANCLKKSKLLIQSKNGVLQLPLDTSEELLETKIMRINSKAVCRHCAPRGRHKGHETIPIKDVEKMIETSKILKQLSYFTLFLLKNEVEDCRYDSTRLKIMGIFNQIFQLNEHYLAIAKKELEGDCAEEVPGRELINKVYSELSRCSNKIVKQHCIEKALKVFLKKKEQRTESANAVKELDKCIHFLEKIRDSFARREGRSELEASDFLHLCCLVSSNYRKNEFRRLFSGISSSLRDLYKPQRSTFQFANNVRRTLPFKVPEKYATLVNGCFKLLIGDEKKMIEEELD